MSDFFALFDEPPVKPKPKPSTPRQQGADFVVRNPPDANSVVILYEKQVGESMFATTFGTAFRNGLALGGIRFDQCTTYAIDGTLPKQAFIAIERIANEIAGKFEVVITIGQTLAKGWINRHFHDHAGVSMERFRGLHIPDHDAKVWLCPIADLVDAPAYGPARKAYSTVLFNDAARIGKLLGQPIVACGGTVDVLSPDAGQEVLLELSHNPPEWFTFDYETTGLKPHVRGHRIYSLSFSTDGTRAWSFLYDKALHAVPLASILRNPNVKKCAANIQMEEAWSRVHVGTKVVNWAWDVNLAAHCADNRTSGAGLKYNSYVHLGVKDWASSIKTYLEDATGCGNGFNRIHECPQELLLTYGGYDSLYEEQLRQKQMKGFGC